MTAPAVEAVPARTRMLARARRLALVALLALLVVAVGASWVAALLADADVGSAIGTHLVVLALLAVAALVIAKRSTRFVEGVFGQQDKILRTVVHEVRAPLGRLLAAVDEGKAGLRPAAEALDEVGAEGEAVTEFISDLTEAARVFAGVLAVPTERAVLAEVIGAPTRAEVCKGAAVVVEPGPGVVIGSPRLLRLALTNLIRNAAQHGYHGGPGVIVVLVDERGIAVLDDGPGVDPSRLHRLTGATAVGLPNATAGFGLTIAAWIAELHGGQLRLANRAGHGFEARLDLPLVPESERAVTPTQSTFKEAT